MLRRLFFFFLGSRIQTLPALAARGARDAQGTVPKALVVLATLRWPKASRDADIGQDGKATGKYGSDEFVDMTKPDMTRFPDCMRHRPLRAVPSSLLPLAKHLKPN